MLFTIWLFLASTGAEIGHSPNNAITRTSTTSSKPLADQNACQDTIIPPVYSNEFDYEADLVLFGVEMPVSDPFNPASPVITLNVGTGKISTTALNIFYVPNQISHHDQRSVLDYSSAHYQSSSAPLCLVAKRLRTGVFRV